MPSLKLEIKALSRIRLGVDVVDFINLNLHDVKRNADKPLRGSCRDVCARSDIRSLQNMSFHMYYYLSHLLAALRPRMKDHIIDAKIMNISII